MSTVITCGERTLDLSQPIIMGVLNVTPDSFSDGGQLYQGAALSPSLLLKRAEQMVSDGAQLLDVGGESTRPGARSVSPTEELERVAPIVEAIAGELDVVISVDTSTPAVIRECARLGAGLFASRECRDKTVSKITGFSTSQSEMLPCSHPSVWKQGKPAERLACSALKRQSLSQDCYARTLNKSSITTGWRRRGAVDF